MAETPVTQAQFAVWTEAEGIQHRNHFHDPPRPDNPAKTMNWFEANRFCDWMSRIVPSLPGNILPAGYNLFCLPTEAEWEYACRAGTETEYHSGDGEAALTEVGWYGEGWERGSTHPVNGKQRNAFHLHDMHGNVWEWCHDLWDQSAYRSRRDGAPDPGWKERRADWQSGLSSLVGEVDNRDRVLRGGSWLDSARWCRSAFRHWWRPGVRRGYGGFRVCLVRGLAAEGGAREQNDQTEAPRGSGVEDRGTRSETDDAGGAGAEIHLPSEHITGAAGRDFFPIPRPDEPPR
jgi:formylglycine-generating enzyme required for sulfatase activity